jgi:hypothetical protein
MDHGPHQGNYGDEAKDHSDGAIVEKSWVRHEGNTQESQQQLWEGSDPFYKRPVYSTSECHQRELVAFDLHPQN